MTGKGGGREEIRDEELREEREKPLRVRYKKEVWRRGLIFWGQTCELEGLRAVVEANVL